MFSCYNIQIFSFLTFLIIISSLIGIIPNNFYHCVNFYQSQITLKINGGGKRNIFCSEGSFAPTNYPDYVTYKTQLIYPTSGAYEFDSGINIVILEWTTSPKNLSHIFHGCSDITEIDLSSFQNSQVRWLGSMFRGCSSLTSINFDGFVTSYVEDMGFMFQDCDKLTSLDLSGFDTSKVTLMWNMFYGCSLLTSLDLSKLITSKVTSMEAMFAGCKSLTSLNLNNFETNLVISLEKFFSNCINLEYIDLSNFSEQKLGSVNNMFEAMPNNVVLCAIKSNINKIIEELGKTLKCYTIIEDYCEINWKSVQKKIIKKTGECIDNCNNNNQYKFEYDNKCYKNCPTGTKNDQNNKCKCLDECLECLDEENYNNLCIECNKGYYPKENGPLYNGKFFECFNNPQGYYLDLANYIYRECYPTCQTCEKGGTASNPNCIICKPNSDCLIDGNDINPNSETKNIEVNNDIYNINDILKEINNLPKNEESNGYYDSIL